ncbi:MAG: DEAD/DEAH box helicase family protein [Saprospiraceae bacterium]
MFHSLIAQRKNEWFASGRCPAASLVGYIRERGQLREPQIEAIETYLFLKIAGQNRPLWRLVCDGFFDPQEDFSQLGLAPKTLDLLAENAAARTFFALRDEFPAMGKLVTERGQYLDFEKLAQAVFYNVSYTDYLFSLPMGAGKTFLMAAFIYLDLYFAHSDPTDAAFAHNFLVVAPSGLKTSIVPSLKTIERFNPAWVVPEPAATQLKNLLRFEVLDQPKSAAKNNRARNPNAQKVAAFQPFDGLMGLVLVVNAEKVILDKLDADQNLKLETQNSKLETQNSANELRQLIGQIPRLAVLIDEVHHAATDDIKLRQVVGAWHGRGAVTTVMGFSGTPYLPAPEKIESAGNALKINQISNTVYHYPLLAAVRSFLKKPQVLVEKGPSVGPLDIVRTGVLAFRRDFGGTVYADGSVAKLAIYCSSIEWLEERVFPFLVGEMGIPAGEILKYHQGNKHHKLPPENRTEFLQLDTPISRKRIVLLVQIGKEGWDCRSLAGVVLSQKGDCPTNMVLQTACRCLRQIEYPVGEKVPEKTALICLNEDNERSLDRQLKDEQHISLADFGSIRAEKNAAPSPRQPAQPPAKISFWKTAAPSNSAAAPDRIAQKLADLRHIQPRDARLETRDLHGGRSRQLAARSVEIGESAQFDYWLLGIVKESFGGLSLADLRAHEAALRAIFQQITVEAKNDARHFDERFPLDEVNTRVRRAFAHSFPTDESVGCE